MTARLLSTGHALRRFREHHPDAEGADLREAADQSTPISAIEANALCGDVSGHGQGGDQYRLALDRRGVFVLRQDRFCAVDPPLVVVTYLRLSRASRRLAQEFS